MWWNQTNRNERLQPILSQSAFSQADLLTQLLAIADEASDLARAFYRKSHELEVVRKGDSTPLTDADTGLHHLIYERLEALFPQTAHTVGGVGGRAARGPSQMVGVLGR